MRPYIVRENGMNYGTNLATKQDVLAELLVAIEQEDLPRIRMIIGANREFVSISFLDAPPTGLLSISSGVTPAQSAALRAMHGGVSIGTSYTVLGYAASLCKLDAITLLIDEFKADPNKSAWMGRAPLGQLVRVDQKGYDPSSDAYKAAALLVVKGADPNKKYSSDFSHSAREHSEKTAPDIVELAWNGMKDDTLGANCRAVFASKDSTLVTFGWQLNRNALPLAGAAVGVFGLMASKKV